MHLCRELRVRKAKAKEMMIFGAPLVSNKLSRLPAMDHRERDFDYVVVGASKRTRGEAMGFGASYIFEKLCQVPWMCTKNLREMATCCSWAGVLEQTLLTLTCVLE
jgi:hypothetical protein